MHAICYMLYIYGAIPYISKLLATGDIMISMCTSKNGNGSLNNLISMVDTPGELGGKIFWLYELNEVA